MATQPPLPPVASAVPPASPSNAAPAPTPVEPPPGFFSTLAGVYAAPVETFRGLAARPSFVAPLLAAIALNVAFTFVWMRKADPVELARTQMEESGVFERVPPERHADLVQRQARLFPIFAWLGPLVFAPIGFVAMAGLFLFIYRFFYASETTFAQSLAVVGWSLLAVGLVSTPLTLLVLALKGEWSVDPRTVIQASPAALFEKGAVPKTVHALLDSIDLFSAWILFLLTAGYAATSKRSLGVAAVGVLAVWGIYVVLKVALAAVF
jgi:Yip1-like protein